MPARIAILGGGFGGLSAAHTLRGLVPDAAITVVDKSPQFRMGLRKLWSLDGRSSPEEGARERTALAQFGIEFRQAELSGIDLAAQTVSADGESLGWDFLVVALGAEGRADLVPDGVAGGIDLYTAAGAAEAGRRLEALERGKVVVAIAGVPIKCPPAPFEAAFLIDDLLRRTGRREQVEIEVISPQPMSIPAAGPAACSAIEGRLGAKGIRFRNNAKVDRVEDGRVVVAGEDVEADLVLYVTAHRPPKVVGASGLAGGESPWVQVDAGTLQTQHEGVFALGDVIELKTGAGMPFPKAGVFAELGGRVAGENVAALIGGRPPESRFDGRGYCFLETGGGEATKVEGDFLSNPPAVRVEASAPEALEAKRQFEQERLERWFGR